MNVQILNYSKKAIAVIGDTKEIKDQLKKIGGSFNAKLRCGAGWIFSAKRRAEVENLINGKTETKENPLAGMRVYVSTYKKYNSGSLEGAWLNISDYATKGEFLNACFKLHKDEAEPELMFQDYENVPSWFISESHIDPELWNYKGEFSETKGKQTKEQRLEILKRNNITGDLEWYAKEYYSRVMEIDGKCFAINKPDIETHFCHDDESDEEVKAFYKDTRTFEFFKHENMKKINAAYHTLETSDTLYIYKSYNGVWGWSDCDKFDQVEPMNAEVRNELQKAYKQVLKDFEKRLQVWWKRYGADKLHVWTYWRDA